MKNRQLIGRCLPSVIQFKRESAHLAGGAIWRYVTLGQLCQSLGVAKGSSKPAVTHCRNRYPSPNGWSDHTRVRPPTPFWGSVGQRSAGFGQKSSLFTRLIVRVWETIPCGAVIKVASQSASGAHKSGEHLCSKSFPSFPCLAQLHLCRPARALLSNAHPWVQWLVRLAQQFLTPMSPVARLSAVWLGQLATKPVFARANPTALYLPSRAAGAFALAALCRS